MHHFETTLLHVCNVFTGMYCSYHSMNMHGIRLSNQILNFIIWEKMSSHEITLVVFVVSNTVLSGPVMID